MHVSGGAVEPGVELEESSEALARRRALAIAGDSVRGGLFLGTLEAVREGVGEAAVRRCLAAGEEPRFLEFFSYPLSTFLKVHEAATAELARGCGGWTQAQRVLGRRAGGDLLTCAGGKALLLLCRGETRRLMNNAPTAYRVAVNHGERSVLWEGLTRGRVVMRRDFMPCAFHEGVLGMMLEATGARGGRVRGTRLDVLDGEYLIEWE